MLCISERNQSKVSEPYFAVILNDTQENNSTLMYFELKNSSKAENMYVNMLLEKNVSQRT